MPDRVSIRRAENLVRLQPTSYLGAHRFEEYRQAIEGARYLPDKDKRSNFAALDKLPVILDRLRQASFEVTIDDEIAQLLAERDAREWLDKKSVEERIDRIDGEIRIENRRRGKDGDVGLYPFQRTGALWLARRHGALLADEQRMGKEQPVSEPVLTPNDTDPEIPYRWRPIGDLKVGDYVIGSNGRSTKVLGVYPQGVKDVFEVVLEGGRRTRCGLDHLWVALPSLDDPNPLVQHTLALKDILPHMEVSGQCRGWRLPVLVEVGASVKLQWVPIKHVYLMPPEESVCIRVAAEDHLYVTNDFILTHNTVQTIVALPPGAPTIIVAPVAAKGVWIGEIERFRPQLKTEVLSGRSSFRWPKPGEILTTSYEILPNIHQKPCDGYLSPERCKGCKEEIVFELRANPDGTSSHVPVDRIGHHPGCNGFLKEKKRCPGCHPFLKQCYPGTVVVGDEAQKIKGSGSLRALRFRGIADAVRANDGRTWLLTGTPLENDPKELWFILRAAGIAEEAFGSWRQFVGLFKGHVLEHGQYTWGLPDDDVVERLQRVCLRRMRKDVWAELPAKRWQEHIVKIDRKTVTECEQLLRRLGGADKLEQLLEDDPKLAFETLSSLRASLATAKIPALLDILSELEQAGEPVVVYSMHRAPVDTLAKLPGWAAITGDVTGADRTEIIKRFQGGELKGLACTIQAAGTGINLSRASYGIFVDLSWKPTENEQAEDRQVHLENKEGRVYTILKADHPVDRRVVEVLMRKRRLIAKSVDASSVTDDAPPEEPPEGKLRTELQRLVQDKTASRRPPSVGAEADALDLLQTGTFDVEVRSAALDLAERAEMCGLSDAEWDLAVRVSGYALTVAAMQANRKVSELNGDAARKVSIRNQTLTSKTQNVSTERPKVVHDLSGRGSRGKGNARSRKQEEPMASQHGKPGQSKSGPPSGGGGRAVDDKAAYEDIEAELEEIETELNTLASGVIQSCMTIISSMSDDMREELFERIGVEFDTVTGKPLPRRRGRVVAEAADEEDEGDDGDVDEDGASEDEGSDGGSDDPTEDEV